MTFEEWKYEVDRLFRVRTLCDWKAISGECAPLQRAFDEKLEPLKFVLDYIDDYGLTDITMSK